MFLVLSLALILSSKVSSTLSQFSSVQMEWKVPPTDISEKVGLDAIINCLVINLGSMKVN